MAKPKEHLLALLVYDLMSLSLVCSRRTLQTTSKTIAKTSQAHKMDSIFGTPNITGNICHHKWQTELRSSETKTSSIKDGYQVIAYL